MKKIVLIVTALMVLHGILTGQVNLDSGLVAYYPFNGDSKDKSGNGRHGTVVGATVTRDRFGKKNSAYSFDGRNDFIAVPDNAFGPKIQEFTISCWIKSGDNIPDGTVRSIFHKGSYNGWMSVFLSENNTIEFQAIGVDLWNSVQSPFQGGWVNVIGLYRRGKNLEIWINGAFGSYLEISEYDLYQEPWSRASIGSFDRGKSQFWKGMIDDIRIYNRAISEDEIVALRNEGGIADYVFPCKGLYMVSLPVIPGDSSVGFLFPDATGGSAFLWNPLAGAYDRTPKMEPNRGYWLALREETSCSVFGDSLEGYTQHLSARGWHMIGSVCGGADFTDPEDNPDGMVLSPAFGWDAGAGTYFRSSDLKETAGYWIASLGECDLTVDSNGVSLPKAHGTSDLAAFYETHGQEPPGAPDIDWSTGRLAVVPNGYSLGQNFPNPFNPQTRFAYRVPKAGNVEIEIFDILGKLVVKLESGHREPGSYEAAWDGKDANGAAPGSGTYMVRMKAGEFLCIRKLVLMR
jgi:hypothetical protein